MNELVFDKKHFDLKACPGMIYSPIQKECMKTPESDANYTAGAMR